MVEYKCNRCNKTFNKKQNYDVHVNRKYKCTINNDKDNNRNIDDSIKKEELYQLLLKQLKIEIEDKKQLQIQIEEDKKQILKEIEELKRQISKENTTINNNTNRGTINNIDKQQNINQQIHINLIAHGKEDLSFITENEFKKILNKGFKSVENFIEHVHFNKNHPENHNIYISNMKDSYLMRYDGNNWKLIHKETGLQDLYEDKTEYLVDKFEELKDKLDDISLRKFERFLNEKDDDQVIEKTKNEIKLSLYNNRKIPEETRKLLKLNEMKKIEV